MTITFFLYDGFTSLDVIGAYEILARLPDAKVIFASKYKNEIKSDTIFFKIEASEEIEKVKQTDILVIPGSTVGFLEVIQDKAILNWIKKMNETSIYTTAVSSGTIILAAAGLLKGKKATSHWYSLRFLTEYGVEIVEERVVKDDKIITCGGSTASIDMALTLAELVEGKEIAEAIQLMLEYDPQPPFDSGSLEKASKETMLLAKRKLKEDALRSGIFGII